MKQRRTYDYQWQRLAHRYLRMHPVCAVYSCSEPAKHVDHIVTVKAAPHRRLDWTNLQGLCHACHNRLTRAYDAGSIRGACDLDGNPLDPGHPWAQTDSRSAIEAANAKPKASPMLAARLKRAAAAGPGGGSRPGAGEALTGGAVAELCKL